MVRAVHLSVFSTPCDFLYTLLRKERPPFITYAGLVRRRCDYSVDTPDRIVDGVVPFEQCFVLHPMFFYHLPFRMDIRRQVLGYIGRIDVFDDPTVRTVLLKANQGAGKTHAMAETIRGMIDEGRVQKVLFIVSRVSHAAQLVHEMSTRGLPLADYRMCRDGYYTAGLDYTVVQLDSLWRHFNPGAGIEEAQGPVNVQNMLQYVIVDGTLQRLPGREIPAVDMVVIDESESTIMHLFSQTMRERQYVINAALETVVRKAKYVLAMDADAGDATLDMLLTLRGVDDTRILWNLKTRETPRRYVIHDRAPLWLQYLIADILAGKCVYVASDSKGKMIDVMAAIQTFVPNLQADEIMTYSADTCDEAKRGLFMCEEEWVQYRIVAATPVITYGVSFARDHFHVIYLYFNRRSVTAREGSQMAGRVRHPIENEVHVFLSNSGRQDAYEHGQYVPESINFVAHRSGVLSAVIKAATGAYAAHVRDVEVTEDEVLTVGDLFARSLFFRQLFRRTDEQTMRGLRFKKMVIEHFRAAGDLVVSPGSVGEVQRQLDVPYRDAARQLARTRGNTNPMAAQALLTQRPNEDAVAALNSRKRRGMATVDDKVSLQVDALYRNLGLLTHAGITDEVLRKLVGMGKDYSATHIDEYGRFLQGLTLGARIALATQRRSSLLSLAETDFAPFAILTGILIHLGIHHPFVFSRDSFETRQQRRMFHDADGFLRDENLPTYVQAPYTLDTLMPPDTVEYMCSLFTPTDRGPKFLAVFPGWESRLSVYAKNGHRWTFRAVLDVARYILRRLFGLSLKTRVLNDGLISYVIHWAKRDVMLEVLLARQINYGKGPQGVDMVAVCKAAGIRSYVLTPYTGIGADTVNLAPVDPDFRYFTEYNIQQVRQEAQLARDMANAFGGPLADAEYIPVEDLFINVVDPVGEEPDGPVFDFAASDADDDVDPEVLDGHFVDFMAGEDL